MHFVYRRRTLALVIAVFAASLVLASDVRTQGSIADVDLGLGARLNDRVMMASAPVPPRRDGPPIGAMTPAERRAAVDALWGPGQIGRASWRERV